MKKLEYTVRFTTPAFLGNAEQSGQWRTPRCRTNSQAELARRGRVFTRGKRV